MGPADARRPAGADWPAGVSVSAAAGRAGGRVTRAEVTAAAVQRIADLAAAAEGEPRRPVPWLGEPVLADQLAVVVDDVLRAGDPAAVGALTAELSALRAALGFPAR